VADSASAPDTRSPSPDIFIQSRCTAEEEEATEPMEVDHHHQPVTASQQLAEVQEDVEMVPLGRLPPPPTVTQGLSSSPYQQGGPGEALRYLAEEADSTTPHNVISIPDTEDIPNIEIGIISEGQVLDSINTKYNVSLLKSESSSPVDSTTTTTTAPIPSLTVKNLNTSTGSLGGGGAGIRFGPAGSVTGPRIQVVSHTVDPRSGGGNNSGMLQLSLPSVASQPGQPRIISLPIRTSSNSSHQQLAAPQQQQAEKMEVDAHHPHVAAPTHYITVSPLSKVSPKKAAVAAVKGGLEKKASNSREREYDPNKHCGVWDGDAKRNCTRSLTCKSHSVYLKRKVINRSGTFDELLAAHKADKELANSGGSRPGAESQVMGGGQAVSLVEAAPTNTDSQSSILARRLQLAPGTLTKSSWEQPAAASNNTILTTQSSLLKPALIRRPFLQQQQQQKQQQYHQTQLAVSAKEFYCDENLHFTPGM
jgi:hypothetical protein